MGERASRRAVSGHEPPPPRGITRRGAWLTLVLGLLLSVWGGLHAFRSDAVQQERLRLEQGDRLSRQMVGLVREHALVARSVESFYRSSQSVEPDEFATFVSLPLGQLPGLTAVAYAPYRPGAPAELRYGEPAAQRPHLVGFTVQDFVPALALESVAAGGATRLVALPVDRCGANVVVLHPLRRRAAGADGNGAVTGFVLLLLNVERVVSPVMQEASGLGLTITVSDAASDHILVGGGGQVNGASTQLQAAVFGADWDFAVAAEGPTEQADDPFRAGLQTWLVLATFTALLAGILFAIAGEQEATARWAARLETLNQELSHEADRREKLLTALSVSEHRFAAFMDHVPALGWVKDQQQRYLYANRSLLAHLNLELSAVVGRVDHDLYAAAAAEEAGRNDLRALRADSHCEAVEPLNPLSGEPGRWLVTRFSFAGDDGTPLLGGIAVDITDPKQAAALARQAEELARSNADLEQFAYVVSHDLQAPLRHVLSYLQILVEDHAPELNAEARQTTERAMAAAERMRALVTDLLAYSRVGRVDRPAAPVDVAALLASLHSEFETELVALGATLTWGPMPRVTVNESRLRQLFNNLIGNALKFRDSQSPTVQITAEPVDDSWLFRVSDNGIGIPEEHRERVFAVFQRLHPPGAYDGTGIGLAVCRKIVDQAGGQIWIEPGEPRGTVVCFTLPADPPASS